MAGLRARRGDWIGSLALGCTLVLLIVGTTQLNKMDSAKYMVLLGLLSAVIFFRIEQKVLIKDIVIQTQPIFIN